MRLLPCIACALACATPRMGTLGAATEGPDASELDGVYAAFSAGYDRLDAAAVAALYTEDALYLGAENDVLRGRREIEAHLRSFFDRVRDRNGKLAI